jgi:hypothetical protein
VENYFNYFTEIEECFRRCRSSHTSANPRLLLSPIDWALIESWKEAGLPLEAVLNGIERTFEKWQRRPRPYRGINSLGFCSQEVLRAADEARTLQIQTGGKGKSNARDVPFEAGQLASFFDGNGHALRLASARATEAGEITLGAEISQAATFLERIAPGQPNEATSADAAGSLEEIERHLTALEEKLVASLTRASTVELLAQFRAEVERGIIPYRGKMTGPQIESLERQFLKKRLFEHYGIPRLSLFYL